MAGAGLATAGAAAGTAIMPGIGTAVGGIVGALADGFMSDSSGSAAAGGPQSAHTGVYGSGLDGSNWNVNFGGTQTNKSSADKSGALGDTASIPGMAAVTGSLGGIPIYVWAALGAVVVWKISKSKK
jgi:hypothetical protein